MTRTLCQRVTFDASPETLFELYMDSKKHAAATGAAATISRKVGGVSTAWDGYATATNLAIVPRRLIVQSWRTSDWKPGDADSILVLVFSWMGRRGRVNLVHAQVPDHQARALDAGWREFYWKPWRTFLADGA